MNQLLPHPLPVGAIEANLLNVGDTFLRLGNNGETVHGIWVLAKKVDNTVAFFELASGSYIDGIGNNFPVVPCEGSFVANL